MLGLFGVLRGQVDERRRQVRRARQFLLLGSASDALLRQSSESLAGRIIRMELPGLDALEVGSGNEILCNRPACGDHADTGIAAESSICQNVPVCNIGRAEVGLGHRTAFGNNFLDHFLAHVEPNQIVARLVQASSDRIPRVTKFN